MIRSSLRFAFAFAMLAATAATPLSASFAAPAAAVPNAADRAMADRDGNPYRSSGIYDNLDQYRDARGFPQAGWEFLILPPS